MSLPESSSTPLPADLEALAKKASALHKHVRTWSIKDTNAFISRVNRLMSTTAGADKALMTIAYTIQLVTPFLGRLPTLLTIPLPTPIPLFLPPPSAATLERVGKSLRALNSLISDVRIFLRLWGLFGIYEWGRSVFEKPLKDKMLQAIAVAQVLANAAYQVLENAAYLAQHGVLPIGQRKQNKMWLWSSRFWMVHVGLEFVKLRREHTLRVNARKGRRGVFGRKDEKEGLSTVDWAEEWAWWRQVLSNCAYAPLTVHWSMEGGALSQPVVGALGTIAAIIGLQNAWGKTSTSSS
ncbi:hypothetical protein RUND412_010098 [Rhizina undulata]